jgi:hypothetical protein
MSPWARGMSDAELMAALRQERTALMIRACELKRQIRDKVTELETIERRLADIESRKAYLASK